MTPHQDRLIQWLLGSLDLRTTLFHLGQYCGSWQASTAGMAQGGFHVILNGDCWLHLSESGQKQKLQAEFKTLLVRTYSGALSQVKDQTLVVKPLRANPGDTEVIVRSELRSPGKDPVQLDYRVEKTDAGWKVYDLNVLGVWLVETYRGQFAQEINAKGLDGLIAALAQRNRGNVTEKPPVGSKG